MAAVRCADCGFSALRHNDTYQLVEIVPDIRTSGTIPHEMRRSGQHFVFDHAPRCLMGSHPLSDEFRNANGHNGQKFLHVLDTERECERFTPWLPGLSPKEHSDMLHEAEWREWQTQQAQLNRGHSTKMAWISFAAVVIAALAIVANILSAWLQKPIPVEVTVKPPAVAAQAE